MKSIHVLALAGIALTVPFVSRAQFAGSIVISISAAGWSAEREIKHPPGMPEVVATK